mgnify:CR=1 FL=1
MLNKLIDKLRFNSKSNAKNKKQELLENTKPKIILPNLQQKDITKLVGETVDSTITKLIISQHGYSDYSTHLNQDTEFYWGYYNCFRNCMNKIIEPKYLLKNVNSALKKNHPGIAPAFDKVSRETYLTAISYVIKSKTDSIKKYWDHYLNQCEARREKEKEVKNEW